MPEPGRYQAILFDLDGTLIDTAIDMILALAQLADRHGVEHALNVADYRQHISYGAVALVKSVFGEMTKAEQEALRVEYLEVYQQQLNTHNQLFGGIDALISHLNQNHIPWGIVTNKPSWLAKPIVANTPELNESQVLVCADEVGVAKPDPRPLLLAARQMGIDPKTTLYLGDAESDVKGAHAAGMVSGVAMWGYLAPVDRPAEWRAGHLIDVPTDLISMLRASS